MKTDKKEWKCIIGSCVEIKLEGGDVVLLRNNKRPKVILEISRAEWDEMKKKIKVGEI